MKAPVINPSVTMFKSIQQHRGYLLLLSLLSALFFWLAWPPHRGAPFLWVALIPLLRILRHITTYGYQHPLRTFYGYVYFSLCLWNLTTTWWIVKTTVVGTLFAILLNTAYLSLPFLLFYWTQKKLGMLWGYLSLVVYWISIEYIHLLWEPSLPWLNLGNGFACLPTWVQWYEYTGTFGGTLWILTINIGLYHLLFEKTTGAWQGWLCMGLWMLLPVLYSYYRYTTYEAQGEAVEVVVVQPNIDPYTKKIIGTENGLSLRDQLVHLINLSEQALTKRSQFLVWPETALGGYFDEKGLTQYTIIKDLIQFKQRYPCLSLLTGIMSCIWYDADHPTKTALRHKQYGYYDQFNTALFLNNVGGLDIYHKMKLVPGSELIPYLYNLKQLPAMLQIKLGDIPTTSLGIGDAPKVFFNKDGIGITPTICYESVYGAHLANFIRKGATLIFVITNDGWFGNTPGYQQHFHYSRLRAIEGRRHIARSANTGISGFINQRGDILQATNYEEQAAIKYTIRANQAITFYSLHGDYLAKIAFGVAVYILLRTGIKRPIRSA